MPAPGPPVRTIFIGCIISSQIVPRIIDYPTVLETLTAQGMRCNYPNGGAFGFVPEANVMVRGWIGPPDGTIKLKWRPVLRQIPEPFEMNLAQSAAVVWQKYLPGIVWVMPASHWAFELQHANGQWLAEAIGDLGLDPSNLGERSDAAAIEFSPEQNNTFRQFAQRLLEGLQTSDFVLAFSERRTVCTVHQHKQLWWRTCDVTVLEGLDAVVPPSPIL